MDNINKAEIKKMLLAFRELASNYVNGQVDDDAIDKFIDEFAPQLSAKKITIKLSAPARQWLAEKGFDPHFGARPLDRLIQKEIKDVLTDQILFGRLTNGGAVYVKVKDNKLMFNYS